MYDDLYCKLFIDTDKSLDEIQEIIENILDVKPDKFHSFIEDYFMADLIINKEGDVNLAKDFPDGFLYFPYFIDFNCDNEEREDDYIELVGKLMNELWRDEMRLVASCDFEHVLPNHGGYNQKINY